MRIICLIPDNNEAVKYAVKFTFDVKVYGKAEVKKFRNLISRWKILSCNISKV